MMGKWKVGVAVGAVRGLLSLINYWGINLLRNWMFNK